MSFEHFALFLSVVVQLVKFCAYIFVFWNLRELNWAILGQLKAGQPGEFAFVMLFLSVQIPFLARICNIPARICRTQTRDGSRPVRFHFVDMNIQFLWFLLFWRPT